MRGAVESRAVLAAKPRSLRRGSPFRAEGGLFGDLGRDLLVSVIDPKIELLPGRVNRGVNLPRPLV